MAACLAVPAEGRRTSTRPAAKPAFLSTASWSQLGETMPGAGLYIWLRWLSVLSVSSLLRLQTLHVSALCVPARLLSHSRSCKGQAVLGRWHVPWSGAARPPSSHVRSSPCSAITCCCQEAGSEPPSVLASRSFLQPPCGVHADAASSTCS